MEVVKSLLQVVLTHGGVATYYLTFTDPSRVAYGTLCHNYTIVGILNSNM